MAKNTHTAYDRDDLAALKASNLPAALQTMAHFDSAEDASVFFARELDFVKAQSYDAEYDTSEKNHKNTTLYALISKIKKSAFPDGSGLLKKEGQDIKTAMSGIDYQPATRKLDASTVEDADSIPIYDESVTGDRRVTFSSLKNSLKQYFDQLYTKVAFDNAPTKGSQNAVTSDGIYTALADKKIFHVGTTPPTNRNLLWIDTTNVTGGLKYHNGSSWVHVPVAYAT